MQIQVLGSGCATCKKLFELTKNAVDELGLGVEVEYITDVQKIIDMGLMSSPVLAMTVNPCWSVASEVEKITEIIAESMK